MSPRLPLLAAAALFSVGAGGVLCRRSILLILISVELMLGGANLAFVAFARMQVGGASPGPVLSGQAFVLFSMAVAAAEATVGLAVLISFYRLRRTEDSGEADRLKG